jgi:hypothetical protein
MKRGRGTSPRISTTSSGSATCYGEGRMDEPPPQPQQQPSVQELAQLADWALQLGVTPQDLRSALEEVGPLVLD